MKKLGLFSLLIAAALLLAPTAAQAQYEEEEEDQAQQYEQQAQMPAEDQGVVATLEARGNFTVLIDALERTGLAEQLKNAEAVTVFAPTDEAFAALPEGTLEALTAEELTAILTYHVVTGSAVTLADAAAQGSVETTQGGTLTVTQQGQTAMVNQATIIEADVEAGNGTIHVVDAVLMPEMEVTSSR